MGKRLSKSGAVFDTNILISAIIYGGTPQKALDLILRKEIVGITSYSLIAELMDVLTKKFKYSRKRVLQIEKKAKDSFIIVQPTRSVKVLKDDPDNRVLEAAVEGWCEHIITGDKELLKLGKYKRIKIVTAKQFLQESGELG